MAIYKRGNVWYYDFTLNGVRYNRSTQARNKRSAEDCERKCRNDLVLGNYGLTAPRLTPVFKTFIEGKFLDHIRVRSAEKRRTVKYYEEKTRRLLEYAPLGGARLSEIHSSLVEDYIQFRAKKKRKIASINRELACLRHALNLAETWGLLAHVRKIKLLPGEVGREFVLSYDLEKLYLAAIRQPLLDAAILMIDTGLRPEECVTRKWEHVHLTPAHDAKFGYVAIEDGKTKNAKRNVPLTARAKQMLETRKLFFPESWVFPGRRKGKHLTIYGLDNIHAQARADTLDNDGRPIFPEPFVIYSLRHTFGTRLGESGADPYTIMKLMGHSSITVSQKYVHPTPEHVERAMARKEAMDRLMRGETQDVTTEITTGDSREL